MQTHGAHQMPTDVTNQVRFLRKSEVIELTGLSGSSIYRLAKQGDFPKQVKLSTQSVAWIESEITGWMQKRIQSRAA